MNVTVEILLYTQFNPNDLKDMFDAAESLTNDSDSVHVYELDSKKGRIFAEFTIDNAAQRTVVDKIAQKFKTYISNYDDISISFPKEAFKSVKATKLSNTGMTKKQGKYLSFIHYYTKLNKTPPAESDFQKYFNVSPPSVHSMILKLEEKGFISRIPNSPRSIKLLLKRSEIPDLD